VLSAAPRSGSWTGTVPPTSAPPIEIGHDMSAAYVCVTMHPVGIGLSARRLVLTSADPL
jgi:hypothetical protein